MPAFCMAWPMRAMNPLERAVASSNFPLMVAAEASAAAEVSRKSADCTGRVADDQPHAEGSIANRTHLVSRLTSEQKVGTPGTAAFLDCPKPRSPAGAPRRKE